MKNVFGKPFYIRDGEVFLVRKNDSPLMIGKIYPLSTSRFFVNGSVVVKGRRAAIEEVYNMWERTAPEEEESVVASVIKTPTVNPFEIHRSPVFAAAWRVPGVDDISRPSYFCAIDVRSGAFFNARIFWPGSEGKHTGVLETEMNMVRAKNTLLFGDGSSVGVRGYAPFVRTSFDKWIGKILAPQLWTFDLWEAAVYFPCCVSQKHDIFDLSTLFMLHNVDYVNARAYAKRQLSAIQAADQPGHYAMVGVYMIQRFKQIIERNEKKLSKRRAGAKRGQV